MVAQFVHGVEHEAQHALQAGLLHGGKTRALQPLAHEHAQHGRLGRVFRHKAREMDARAVGPGREQQLEMIGVRPQQKDDLLLIRLIDLFHPGFQCGVCQLLADMVQKCSVKSHGKHSLSLGTY